MNFEKLFNRTSAKTSVQKKPGGKSLFRKINDWLHLWLGIASGIVVFIVSLTGCFYAFEREISDMINSYQFVETQNKPYLPPSKLKAIALKEAFGTKADSAGNTIYGVEYAAGKAAIAAYNHKEKGYTAIYINPYTGAVLGQKIYEDDFFRWILMGHYYLWLPEDIGQPLVASSVLIFVFLLISGMIMWWPKNLNKINVDKSFKVKWKASFKRVNYDLHNVLGFYTLTIALILAVTGLVWGFEWFAKSYYWTLSGGKTMPEFRQALSDTTLIPSAELVSQEDKIWRQMLKEYPDNKGSIDIEFAEKNADPISVYYNPDQETYYKREFRHFDRYTLKEMKGAGLYAKKFDQASVGDKIYLMNYDIHVGAILGLPGKIMAFMISLVCASLPITGFIIWWGRRKKSKKVANGDKKLAKKTVSNDIRQKPFKVKKSIPSDR